MVEGCCLPGVRGVLMETWISGGDEATLPEDDGGVPDREGVGVTSISKCVKAGFLACFNLSC